MCCKEKLLLHTVWRSGTINYQWLLLNSVHSRSHRPMPYSENIKSQYHLSNHWIFSLCKQQVKHITAVIWIYKCWYRMLEIKLKLNQTNHHQLGAEPNWILWRTHSTRHSHISYPFSRCFTWYYIMLYRPKTQNVVFTIVTVIANTDTKLKRCRSRASRPSLLFSNTQKFQ